MELINYSKWFVRNGSLINLITRLASRLDQSNKIWLRKNRIISQSFKLKSIVWIYRFCARKWDRPHSRIRYCCSLNASTARALRTLCTNNICCCTAFRLRLCHCKPNARDPADLATHRRTQTENARNATSSSTVSTVAVCTMCIVHHTPHRMLGTLEPVRLFRSLAQLCVVGLTWRTSESFAAIQCGSRVRYDHNDFQMRACGEVLECNSFA